MKHGARSTRRRRSRRRKGSLCDRVTSITSAPKGSWASVASVGGDRVPRSVVRSTVRTLDRSDPSRYGKIAYAAPIVAASFKLSAHGARAAVSGGATCDGGADICTSTLNCAGGTCFCNENVGGGTSCNGFGECAACATHSDCDAVTGAGSSCITGGCCPTGTACVAPCPDSGVAADEPQLRR
jgi:hypothetical protein